MLSDLVRETPGRVVLRIELARALERTGSAEAAVDHLKFALSVAPRSALPLARLVPLLRRVGRSAEAAEVLARTAAVPGAPLAQRMAVAALALEGGEADTVLAALDRPHQALPPAGLLMRAEALATVGRRGEADAAFAALTADTAATPAAIAAAADFVASQGRTADARAILDRLAAAGASDDDVRRARARFETRHGDPAPAQQVAAADSPVHAKPTADVTPQASVGAADLRSLIATLATDPLGAADADTLRSLPARPDAVTFARLRAVALKYPASLALQTRVADAAAVQGDFDEAIAAGRRAADALPDDATAVALRVRTLRAAGRWDDVRAACEKWKRRPGADGVAADALIADAWLASGRADRAAAAIAPHAERLAADPSAAPQAAFTLARVRVAGGDVAAARSLLRPLLGSAVARTACRSIAGTDAQHLADACALLGDADAAMPKVPNPADAGAERFASASAWAGVGRRFDDGQTLAHALAAAEACLAAAPTDANARLLQAGLLAQTGRPAAAEAALRIVLDTRPDAAAANDLACLLLDRPAAWAEAERLARRAVDIAPTAAAFHDTLARVLTRTGRTAEAKKAFETALRLDPKLTAAREGLAGLAAGQRATVE